MTCFGYTRVSTEEQVSCAMQRDLILETCVRLSLDTPTEIIADDGVSTTYVPFRERPGMCKLLRLVQPGDHLVVWRLDRIERGFLTFYDALRQVVERGVEIHSIEDYHGMPLDLTTAAGRAVVSVLQMASDFYRESVRENTRRSKAWRKQNNMAVGSPYYCHYHTGPRKKRAVEWDTAMLEQIMHVAYLRTHGTSWEDLIRHCQSKGYKSATGVEWWRVRHKPDAPMALVHKKRYERIQEAVNWLFREMRARRLPEPYQGQVRQMGVPHGVRLNPFKRRSPARKATNHNGNGSAIMNDPTPLEVDTWSAMAWASWWKERQRAEG